MQECPSCYELISVENFVTPHCGAVVHSACKQCTELWYKQNTDEPCMVCRVKKKSVYMTKTLPMVCLGVSTGLLSTWLFILKDASMLLFMVYVCAMFYFYFKDLVCTVSKRQLWISFFIGTNVTILSLITLLWAVDFKAEVFILNVGMHFIFMILIIHSMVFIYTYWPIQTQIKYLRVLNIVNMLYAMTCFFTRAHAVYTMIYNK